MAKKFRIAMAGGGSGGHVFPIRSMIQYIDENHQFSSAVQKIYRFGSCHGLEKRTAKQIMSHINTSLQFIHIASGKYRRKAGPIGWFKNMIDMLFFFVGCVASLFWLITYRINVIFCKGGYVALPVVIAGRLLKIKIIAHESDVRGGLTNRIAYRFAQQTFTGFPHVFPFSTHIGQILSDDIVYHPTKDKHIAQDLGLLAVNKTKILVTGGSQGSLTLYEAVARMLQNDATLGDYFHFYVTGGIQNEEVSEIFAPHLCVEVIPFATQKQMGALCYHCDIGITRGGTTSMAEQKLYDMRLIIVPIPRTHDQYDNAAWYMTKYDDIVIDQADPGFFKKFKKVVNKHKGFRKTYDKKNPQQHIHHVKKTIANTILS